VSSSQAFGAAGASTGVGSGTFYGTSHTGGGGGFGARAKLIDDENDLKGDLDMLSKEDLKERLYVAERVMKTLFQRNKELE